MGLHSSSRRFIKPLVTVPRALTRIGLNVTFMFHSFFNSQARSRYLSFFSFSFNLTRWSAGTTTSTIRQVLFSFYFLFFLLMLLIIIRSGRLAEIRWSVCILKSQKILCVSFSRNCSYRQSSISCTFPSGSLFSCLVLYAFWASLLHSLNML